jgi:hypothetical protein
MVRGFVASPFVSSWGRRGRTMSLAYSTRLDSFLDENGDSVEIFSVIERGFPRNTPNRHWNLMRLMTATGTWEEIV